jgi:chemotaxis protein methyltransferase CheR
MNRFVTCQGKLAHVTFPAEEKKRRVVNFAAWGDLPTPTVEADQPLSDEIAAFLEWLFLQADLDFRMYRAESLIRRLPACFRALRVSTASQARALLERQPALKEAALSAMLVGVTSFFRDPSVFRMLRSELFSLAGTRGALYVWSIGCSDGAELYSVGIMLAELDLLKDSYLLGTDCRADCIRRAKRGAYEYSEVKDVPSQQLSRSFDRQDSQFRVDGTIRTATQWRIGDILKTHEPGVWDLILFRNTAMYMRAQGTDAIWQRLEHSLRPGGILVLGKAERPTGVDRLSFMAPCLYRRHRRQPC